jgi:O-antigen ligase
VPLASSSRAGDRFDAIVGASRLESVAVGSAVLPELGAVVGASGAALILLSRVRVALLTGLGLLGVGAAALAASLSSSDEARNLVASPPRLGLAFAATLLLLAAAALFVRLPAIVPIALLLAAPFRVPVDVGDEKAFLLVPLYGLLVSSALALAFRALRGDRLPTLPPVLGIPAALFVGLAAVSLFWSQDVRSGTIKLAFVLFPFALLVAVLARTPFRPWLPRALAVTLISLATAFALLGFWQLATKDLFFAKDVEAANAYAGFFRVTAVFNDPSIYGRYLALAIVLLLVALWLGRVSLPLGIGVIAVLSAGLYFAYSQSSLVALSIGVLTTTLVAADARSRRIVVVASLLLALVAGGVVLAISRNDPLRHVTSGRSDLVANTTQVIREHPLVGVGIGAEREASGEEAQAEGRRLGKASHTAVLTVAAELGIVGAIVFFVFLFGAVSVFAAARARDGALGLGLGVVFLVIFVHSIFYSGFFEDPLVWGALGVAAAARAAAQPVVAIAGPQAGSTEVRPEPVGARSRSTPA